MRVIRTLSVCVVVAGLLAPSSLGGDAFVVFDALLYKGKPDLSSLGMRPISVLYTYAMWPNGADIEEINAPKLRKGVEAVADQKAPIVLDIEHWKVRRVPPPEVKASIAKYLEALAIARSAAPRAKIGYYGLVPDRDYWAIVKPGSGELREWNRVNRELRPIAKEVDILFPSIYAFYDNPKGWETYAREMLRQARRYKKPVCPFVWPQYHSSNAELAGTTIPSKFWARQLTICKRYADGVVIWGGHKKEWDENAPWWIATKTFLLKLQERRGR